MIDPATGQRSFIQALKVPFDLKGVAAGALAYLALVLVGREIVEGGSAWSFFDRLRGADLLRPWRFDDSVFWKLAVLYLAVAAVFGVASARIAGMRLARDEGVDLSDAMAFSIRNIAATVGAFLFMGAAMAFFYACNALAGIVSGIPAVGPILMIVLYPLVLLSTLILFLLAFGTALGLPLTLSSLAVERNGALDAVSRAFSYVFSRPVLFFAYAVTVYLMAGLLAACALGIETLAGWSFTHWFPSSESYAELSRAVDRAGDAILSVRMPQFGGISGMAILGGWVAWIFGMLFHLTLFGWVVYYVYGGATAAYFALRHDVDGTEDEEIWVEGEDQGAFGEPEKPEPVPPLPPATTTPASPPPPPAPGGAAPPSP